MRDGDNWVGIHIVLCFCFDSGKGRREEDEVLLVDVLVNG